MIPASLLTLISTHFSIIFSNLEYNKTVTFNSLVTGVGIDAVTSYLFIYKYAWGMQGIALTQILVKAARIVLWIIEIYYFDLAEVFFGTKESWRSNAGAAANAAAASTAAAAGSTNDGRGGGLRERLLPSLASEEGQQKQEHGDGATVSSTPEDILFSWKEFYVFLGLALPAVLVCLTGWFIFELQILAMAHIAGIPKAA